MTIDIIELHGSNHNDILKNFVSDNKNTDVNFCKDLKLFTVNLKNLVLF